MAKYTVELNANVAVRYSLEVEASNEQEAMRIAVERAPHTASYWDLCGDDVEDVDAVDTEEILEEEES